MNRLLTPAAIVTYYIIIDVTYHFCGIGKEFGYQKVLLIQKKFSDFCITHYYFGFPELEVN